MPDPKTAALKTALLVEDDPNIARLYEKLLWPWRVKGRLATSVAEAALALESGEEFALACVNVGLPDGSGLDVVAMIRSRHPSMPILVVTGRQESMDGAGTVVLRKPFTIAQFQIAIDEVVQAMQQTA